MKTKITTCIVLALMLLSGISQAQQRDRTKRMQKTKVQLTDTQKEELKAARVQFAKATLSVKNELNELKAKQKTLMSAEKLNDKQINGNIDKISALQKQLMKERINMQLATSGLPCRKPCDFRNGKRDCSKKRPQHMKPRRKGMHKTGKEEFRKKKGHKGANMLGLSEAQQEKMKNLRIAHKKETQNLREEMQELRLKQKHMLNDEEPNKNAIMQNIDRISSIQNQLAKDRVVRQKEVRNILDKEQLILFLSKSHKMKKNRRGRMHRAS